MTRLVRWLFGAPAAAWLAPQLARYRYALLYLLTLSLLAAAIGLAPPYLTKLLIDDGLMAKNSDALFWWAGVLFLVGLGAVLLGAYNSLTHMRFSAQMLNDVRLSALSAFFYLPAQRHAHMRVGEMMSRIDGDASEVQKFAFDALLSGVGAIFRLCGGAIMLLVLDWRLALIVIALAPMEFAFLTWARPRTEHHAGEVRESRGRLSSFLVESITGVMSLKNLAAESVRYDGYATQQNQHLDRLVAQRRWQEIANGVPTVLTAIVRSIVLLVAGYWVINDGWPLGSLIAFLAYMGFLVGPMRTLLGLYHAQARVKVSMQRLMLLMEGAETASKSISADQRTPADIRFSEVSFNYPQQPSVLNRVDLVIPQGEKVLLQGASGSGKSTLLGLLTQAYPAASGVITLAGQDMALLGQAQLRDTLTIVTQNEYFFSGTIRENLRLANPTGSDEAFWSVLETAQLVDWLRTEGRGLDTVVSEKAVGFSGGQRQRLAIARALLRPFEVLILDESFSEIDLPTAQTIMQKIDRDYADKTRIVVTHWDEAQLGPFDQVLNLSSSGSLSAALRMA